MNLVYLLKEGRSEDCSAFYVAEKTDLILCTESPKKSELTESADRSIARKAEALALGHHRRPPRRLDKQCLLIEVHIQDPEYPHSGTPKNTHPGTLHSPVPTSLVTLMDRYARSWMAFLQTNVCASERTPHAPSQMLQVAGRGFADLLRTPLKRSSQNTP